MQHSSAKFKNRVLKIHFLRASQHQMKLSKTGIFGAQHYQRKRSMLATKLSSVTTDISKINPDSTFKTNSKDKTYTAAMYSLKYYIKQRKLNANLLNSDTAKITQ